MRITKTNQAHLTPVTSSHVSPPSVSRCTSGLHLRTLSTILLCAVLSFLVNVANAQEPPDDGNQSSPIQIIGSTQFNQMVQNGQLLLVTPAVLVNQGLHTLATDLKNKAVVDQFMRQNPNLPGFAQLVAATPTDPKVHLTLEGNYRTVITNGNGITQTIETMGQGTKLAALADSIQSASDPVKQLALYQSAYSQYTALYSKLCANSPVGTSVGASPAGCANLIVPSALADPATLQNASLSSIQSAITSLSFLGSNILHMVPFPLSGPLPCDAEVGASTAPGVIPPPIASEIKPRASGSRLTLPAS